MAQLGGVQRWEKSRRTTTGTVKAGAGVLHGWFVNTATAAGTVALTDANGAILEIPIGAAAGSATVGLDVGFAGTLTATFNGTGDITFLYR